MLKSIKFFNQSRMSSSTSEIGRRSVVYHKNPVGPNNKYRNKRGTITGFVNEDTKKRANVTWDDTSLGESKHNVSSLSLSLPDYASAAPHRTPPRPSIDANRANTPGGLVATTVGGGGSSSPSVGTPPRSMTDEDKDEEEAEAEDEEVDEDEEEEEEKEEQKNALLRLLHGGGGSAPRSSSGSNKANTPGALVHTMKDEDKDEEVDEDEDKEEKEEEEDEEEEGDSNGRRRKIDARAAERAELAKRLAAVVRVAEETRVAEEARLAEVRVAEEARLAKIKELEQQLATCANEKEALAEALKQKELNHEKIVLLLANAAKEKKEKEEVEKKE